MPPTMTTTTAVASLGAVRPDHLPDDPNGFPAGIPASPPSAAMSEGGAIDLIYRQPGTAHLMVSWQTAPASGWDPSPDDIWSRRS
jgi:hypothetical protein